MRRSRDAGEALCRQGTLGLGSYASARRARHRAARVHREAEDLAGIERGDGVAVAHRARRYECGNAAHLRSDRHDLAEGPGFEVVEGVDHQHAARRRRVDRLVQRQVVARTQPQRKGRAADLHAGGDRLHGV